MVLVMSLRRRVQHDVKTCISIVQAGVASEKESVKENDTNPAYHSISFLSRDLRVVETCLRVKPV